MAESNFSLTNASVTVVDQLLAEATQRAMQACGSLQGARDVTSLPDLMSVVERLQVAS